MDIFGTERKQLKKRIDEMQSEIYLMKTQLSQWRTLFTDIKKYDWFEIGEGNVIIAHDDNEPVGSPYKFGTLFSIPHLFSKLKFD